MKIDLDRCRRGMKQLRIDGFPRSGLIEEAIAIIQKNPSEALKTRYLGIKNYASFGDQREDHEYGYGPKHGTIVFRIGRREGYVGSIDSDAIHLLEAYRDFDPMPWSGVRHGRQEQWRMPLCEVLTMYDRLTEETGKLRARLDSAAVEDHATAVAG